MADTATLVEQISKLSMLEVSELVKALEDKFGVKAAAPMAFAPGAAAHPAASGGAAAAGGVAGLAMLAGIAVSLWKARSLVHKEFFSYFLSPIAYAVLVVFLGVQGWLVAGTLSAATSATQGECS